MQIFRNMIAALAETPAWVPLLLLPALLAAGAVLFTLFGGRRAYPYAACVCGAAGFALLCCMGTAEEAFVYLGLFAALAALLRLLFFLPRVRKKRADAPKSRAERLYERFREELTELPDRPAAQPPKVCCFEEPSAPVQDAPEPSYAMKLLEKLQKEKLSPTDRLETDVLSHTVSGLGGRPLSEEEARTLNDCLASVLRLTAKYKL